MARLAAVIMAGGRGERFWPVSTLDLPKQFLNLTGSGTLVQQTVNRVSKILPLRNIYLSTGKQYMMLARAQLPQLPSSNLLAEPVGRDTAPSLALAAAMLLEQDPDTIMLCLPADHYIRDEDSFCDVLLDAAEAAERANGLITIGIRPDRPETGYGYIEVGDQRDVMRHGVLFNVRRFVEKPDEETATRYLATGRFLWNSGIFVWKASTLLAEVGEYLPELHHGVAHMLRVAATNSSEDVARDIFSQLPKISIDYGILERSRRVFVIPGDFGWDDLGSWSAVARLRERDGQGNSFVGPVTLENCENVLVEAQGNRIVAALGLRDVIVIDTDKALLVCARDQAQNVRRLAQKVRINKPL